MKYLLVLSVSLVLMLGNVARAASFDSETATVQKSGKSAKIMVEKKTYMVPVSFKDDATWTAVKDHYELSPESVSAVKAGKTLMVAADGTISFATKSCSAPCKK